MNFEPDTLYSLKDLRKKLHGLVEWPTFLERLGLRNRIFKDAVWGWEIIEAAHRAAPFSEVGRADAAELLELDRRCARKGKGNKTPSAIGRLSAKDLRD